MRIRLGQFILENLPASSSELRALLKEKHGIQVSPSRMNMTLYRLRVRGEIILNDHIFRRAGDVVDYQNLYLLAIEKEKLLKKELALLSREIGILRKQVNYPGVNAGA